MEKTQLIDIAIEGDEQKREDVERIIFSLVEAGLISVHRNEVI